MVGLAAHFAGFNTQPPEGGWAVWYAPHRPCDVSTHSRLKAAGCFKADKPKDDEVSTHSRLKAAGPSRLPCRKCWKRFNTQPPEGGWICRSNRQGKNGRFNTQPPEGGWRMSLFCHATSHLFQHTAA